MSIEDIERFKNSVVPTPITFFERFGFFIMGSFAGGIIGFLLSLIIAKLGEGLSFTAICVITLGFAILFAIISTVYPRKMSKFLVIFAFFSPSGPGN